MDQKIIKSQVTKQTSRITGTKAKAAKWWKPSLWIPWMIIMFGFLLQFVQFLRTQG